MYIYTYISICIPKNSLFRVVRRVAQSPEGAIAIPRGRVWVNLQQ